jgi:hypothetical protein
MNTSSRLQIFQEVISSMNNQRFVYNVKPTSTVWLPILFAFALLVCFNGTVKAASFPEGKALADLPYLNVVGNALTENRVTDGINQFVELSSAVPGNGEAVAEKKTHKKADKAKCDVVCKNHCPLLDALVWPLGFFAVGVLVAWMRSELLYP